MFSKLTATACLVALALSGCATATKTMQGYLGQPLQAAMIDYGPPQNAFDMPDGTRAFQWVMSSTYVTPTNVNNYGNAYAAGNAVNWYQNTQITGGQPITNECAYTMFARWSDAQNAWVFTSFKKPKMLCE